MLQSSKKAIALVTGILTGSTVPFFFASSYSVNRSSGISPNASIKASVSAKSSIFVLVTVAVPSVDDFQAPFKASFTSVRVFTELLLPPPQPPANAIREIIKRPIKNFLFMLIPSLFIVC